jgi:hypothetical protein
MVKYDKMKFITLFNKLQYDKPTESDNIEYESFADYLVDDIDLKKMSPERFNYYKELISIFNKNPQILYNILKKYYRHKDIKENEAKYLKQLAYYDVIEESKDSVSEIEDTVSSNQWSVDDDVLDLNPAQKKALKEMLSNDAQIGGAIDDNYVESKFRNILKKNYDLTNISKLNQPIYSKDVSSSDSKNVENYYKINTKNKLQNISDKIDKFKDGDSDYDAKAMNNDLNKFIDDPMNPLNELELTFDDRLVFIISTFLIRYISLSIIKWCIDINIIKTFSDGFLYYAIIYLSIFWFIVFFVNIDNNIQVDYMNFDNFMNSIRSVLYYYYMGTNGISRLFVHSSLIMVLLIIPIILNIRNKKPYEYDDDYNTENELIEFEERNKLNRSLSTFTIYIWILTSIIATKY